MIMLKISAYTLDSKYIAYGFDKQNCRINTLSILNTLYIYNLLYKFLGIYIKDAYMNYPPFSGVSKKGLLEKAIEYFLSFFLMV